MERRLVGDDEQAARSRSFTVSTGSARYGCAAAMPRIGRQARVARGRAIHLQHRGFTPRNTRTSTRAPAQRSRQTAKPGDVSREGQSPRSSRSTGEPCTWRGGTVSSTRAKPPERATYVAPQSDKDWLRSVQRALYARSEEQLDYVFRKLWGFVTDPRNLRIALARVASNRGARTSGVDGKTVRMVLQREGADVFVSELRAELRSGRYRPNAARRVLIPKAGQPGKFRPLGIPTVRDRVVQAAMKNVLEPVFEADFFPVSYGFRPGKSAHAALEHLRLLLRPKERGSKDDRQLPYQWAIEGDIKGCFDNISHHGLMNRVRLRISDPKVNRLVVAFLKAGVLADLQRYRTEAGTPQGGILSPLLANIALSAIEERYARHAWPRRIPTARRDATTTARRAQHARTYDRRHGKPVLFPIRYADDFIILVGAPLGASESARDDDAHQRALEERESLARSLKETLGLELSETKTLVTPVTSAMRFLGHHVRVRRHPAHGRLVSATVIPKDRSHRLRERIKSLFDGRTVSRPLGDRLRQLNFLVRGWCNFYRHAWGAKRVFAAIDHHAWHTVLRWLRKKHQKVAVRQLLRMYGDTRRRTITWREGPTALFRASSVAVAPFEMHQLRPPHFAAHGEPGA